MIEDEDEDRKKNTETKKPAHSINYGIFCAMNVKDDERCRSSDGNYKIV